MATVEQRVRRLQRDYEKEDLNAKQTAIRLLLSSPEGRRFLWFLLERSRIFHQPYANNALQTAFNCGELNVGQQLFAEILETDQDAFSVLQKENLNVTNRRSAALARASTDSDSDDGADSESYAYS